MCVMRENGLEYFHKVNFVPKVYIQPYFLPKKSFINLSHVQCLFFFLPLDHSKVFKYKKIYIY